MARHRGNSRKKNSQTRSIPTDMNSSNDYEFLNHPLIHHAVDGESKKDITCCRAHEEDIGCIPLLAIEEIKPEYWSDMGSNTLSEEGGLYPKRIPKISMVHLVYPSKEQVYWIRNLRRGPHYNVPRAHVGLFMEVLGENGIPFRIYNATQSYINTALRANSDLPFVQVVNHGTVEFNKIVNLYQQLALRPGKQAIGDDIGSRGNITSTWGYSGQNTKRDPVTGQSGCPEINLDKLPEERVNWMVLLSKISKELNLPFVDIMQQDKDRLDEFARKIHPENLFEGGVRGRNRHFPEDISLQADSEAQAKEGKSSRRKSNAHIEIDAGRPQGDNTTSHVDQFNCYSPGFEWQVVASGAFANTDPKEPVTREFVGAFGRSACLDYQRRESSSDIIASMIVEYRENRSLCLQHLGPLTFSRKKRLVAASAHMKPQDRVYACKTCINKDAVYSYFAWVGHLLAAINANYYQQTKTAICLGIVSTLDTFWLIFVDLRDKKVLCSGKSWLVLFITRSGTNPRIRQAEGSLRTWRLRRAVVKITGSRPCLWKASVPVLSTYMRMGM